MEPAREVVRDAAAWEALWSQVTQLQFPPPERPAIDFQRRMAIVVAMGRRPTAGYRVAIEGIYEKAGRLYVDVLSVSPAAGCLVAQVLTAPMVTVVVDRVDGPVEFLERTATEACR